MKCPTELRDTNSMILTNKEECKNRVFGTKCEYRCRATFKRATKHNWLQCVDDGNGGVHWSNGVQHPYCESKFDVKRVGDAGGKNKL